MKYFTREIWAGWQAKGAVYDRAMKEWKRNSARYRRAIGKVASELGPKHGKFFTEHSLHDGHLLAFLICDWPRAAKAREKQPETSVRMEVLSRWESARIYELCYAGVTEISVLTKNDLFPLGLSRFGDWGYDELLREGRYGFRHNILFQTGTEISIVFDTFRFSRRKQVA